MSKLEVALDRCEPKLNSLNTSVLYSSTVSYKTLNLSALGTVEMKYVDKQTEGHYRFYKQAFA